MDNLHFLPNNILTRFFKELTKYKNDYISIVFKLWIMLMSAFIALVNNSVKKSFYGKRKKKEINI